MPRVNLNCRAKSHLAGVRGAWMGDSTTLQPLYLEGAMEFMPQCPWPWGLVMSKEWGYPVIEKKKLDCISVQLGSWSCYVWFERWDLLITE